MQTNVIKTLINEILVDWNNNVKDNEYKYFIKDYADKIEVKTNNEKKLKKVLVCIVEFGVEYTNGKKTIMFQEAMPITNRVNYNPYSTYKKFISVLLTYTVNDIYSKLIAQEQANAEQKDK